MKANDLDKKFDAGENVLAHFDLKRARRPGQTQQRVNVDLLPWMVTRLDKEAKRLGIARQALIKVWLAERLDKAS